MAYIHEASSWQRRRRRRQQVTLAVVLLLLLGAGAMAFAYYQGAFGSSAGARTVTTLPPCPTGRPPLTNAGVRVNVYNATSRDGLASDVAAELRRRSFRIAAVANDPRRSDPRGTAVVRHGRSGKAAALLVQAQVPKARLLADRRRGATVDLVIGAAFTELAPAAKPTPSATATACTTVPPTPPGSATTTRPSTTTPSETPKPSETAKPSGTTKPSPARTATTAPPP